MLAIIRRLLGLSSEGPRSTADLGRAGEDRAALYLRDEGYRVLARNLRVRVGEADLVAEAPDGRTIVIVEVKTRRPGDGSPPPEASVTALKRAKLSRIAKTLARLNGWEGRPVRVDVIGIDWGEGGARVRHWKDILV